MAGRALHPARGPLLVLLALVLAAAAAPLAAWALGTGPLDLDLQARLLPPGAPGHALGTDHLGRDVLLRLLYGARVSLLVGVGATALATAAGLLLGLWAGVRGGWVDAALMRLTDALLALPALPLMMVWSALDATRERSGALQVTLILAALGWMTVARLARAVALQVKGLDFVLAARALGASPVRIMVDHMLPHALPAVTVAATLEVGANILNEAALSFLGLGIRAPDPSWGNMLTYAQQDLAQAPWLALWPGLLILVTVGAFHVLGDALRDRLDPRFTLPRR